MAKFEGKLQDFHVLVGPKIRNDVATITKKKKSELNSICQKCNTYAELDAAHIHGRSRKDIIRIVLDNYKSNNDQYLVPNLYKVIEEIKAEHMPVEKNFIFLCKKCHTEYDSWTKNLNSYESKTSSSSKIPSNKPFQTKNKFNSIDGNDYPQEILCEIETNSWKYKLGWTSIQNRKNIEELILKIESTLDCIPSLIKSWYYHRRSDNGKQFSGIICHKNNSLICFRINPNSFDEHDSRIIRGKKWFYPQGQEARIEIIPENYDLIMKCLSYAYDISA
jgi:hypothetical protein